MNNELDLDACQTQTKVALEIKYVKKERNPKRLLNSPIFTKTYNIIVSLLGT